MSPPSPATRQRLILLALSGALAAIVGFVLVSPRTAERLIAVGGYFYMAGLFALFCFFAWRVASPRRVVWQIWLRRPGWPGVALAVATAFVLWSDPFQHKVLFDEYVLQATAFQMHATKEIGTTIRAYDLFGTWLPIDTFVDKRPYFFTFLLSLVHDATGYRLANIFFFNSALAAAFLALAYWLARELTNRTGGLLAVALLASLPLLGQNATGAGMEIHNLAMLALVMALALLCLRAPDDDRVSLLCLGAVLLAQSRYESAIFVVPVALVLLTAWWRAGRVILPWPALVSPLLLIPYALHNRMVSASPLLWQLHDGQTARFSLGYLADNLDGAWKFFLNTGPSLANSWYLSVLGLAALAWSLGCALRWARSRPRAPLSPAVIVLALFALGIAANLAVIMFYYWGRLDDVIVSRLALPACLAFALAAAALVMRLAARWPLAPRAAFAGVGVFLLVSALPAMAHRLYTSQNLIMQEVDWEHGIITARARGPVLFISNKSTIPWVLWRIPSIIIGVARLRPDHLRWHLVQGTFHEVLVAQALRPTTPGGKFGVDPDDVLPPNYRLEPLAEKRFGARMARISRLVAVDAPSVLPRLAEKACACAARSDEAIQLDRHDALRTLRDDSRATAPHSSSTK